MGMFGKCKGPGWGAHGSLFWLLRNQTLRRCRCGLCPLVSSQCGPGVSWGRGPASWIEPPPPPTGWVLTLAGVSHCQGAYPAPIQAELNPFPDPQGRGFQ